MDSFVLPANLLARQADNAQHFIPKGEGVFSGAWISYGLGRLTFLASDGVIAGRETVLAMTSGDGWFRLDADTLDALDKAIRPDKKNPVRVEVGTQEIRVIDSEGEVTDLPILGSELKHLECLDHLRVIFQRVELASKTLPPNVLLDPKRLIKLCRIKPDQTDRVMDFAFSDNYEPVLVKIGADFTGMIMPIHREIHGHDPDRAAALWS